MWTVSEQCLFLKSRIAIIVALMLFLLTGHPETREMSKCHKKSLKLHQQRQFYGV